MPSYKSKKIGSKLCLKCNQVQTLDRFYTHKEWSTQSFRDAWCKDCAAKACVSKEGTREYCWYNNRRWSDTYWDMAMKKGKYALTTDADYLTARTDEKRRELEERMAGRFFFSIMNLDGVYGFSSNIDPDGAFKEFNPDSTAGTVVRSENDCYLDDGELIYSRIWNGMYTQREIDVMASGEPSEFIR